MFEIVLARVQLLLFFIAFTIPFLYTLSTMMEEKSKGLVGYMTLLGLKVTKALVRVLA